jgi:hypothetical protein
MQFPCPQILTHYYYLQNNQPKKEQEPITITICDSAAQYLTS